MDSRWRGIPIVVFLDARTNEDRCINGLHVQTFIRNPSPTGGTIITFASGDTVTVTENFDRVFRILTGQVDG